ncbi:MAG TPA: MoxR family ATPase [Vicinamibacterales bacterium]|jgi:MoxR-like ATPase|nr:MoxR family ATPase [Vicinamibacterales bacterium]
MEAAQKLARHVLTEMGKVVVGQEPLKRGCVLALLCEGHALIEGVPGVAKTLAMKTLARLLGLGYQRVQCTADLMPADIIGTNVVNLATGSFVFHQGPVFTDLLLVDEINRMPPRTQAALLECMEERQVSIDGVRNELTPFFSVFATQNPVEFEGTYPLPEAQLDRFLVKIQVPYPDASDEARILLQAQQGFDARHLDAVPLAALDPQALGEARRDVRSVNVEASLLTYVVHLVRQTRDWPAITLGASPRAAVNLMLVAQALAAIDGRPYIVPDDVKEAALPVLRHRLVLAPEANLEGITADQTLRDIIQSIAVPQ